MNIKKLISAGLLAFVVFSIGFLIYKEFALRQKKVEPSKEAVVERLSTPALVEGTVEVKDSAASTKKMNAAQKITKKQGTVSAHHTDTDIEPDKSTAKSSLPPENAAKEKEPVPPPSTEKDINSKVVAYYFHTTYRCQTCLNIENYSREAIEKYFSQELQGGRLEFKIINIELPENRHYIQEYQLYTKSLVIVLLEGDKQKKWKNLTDIWNYVWNREKFYQYVKAEVEKFLQEAK